MLKGCSAPREASPVSRSKVLEVPGSPARAALRSEAPGNRRKGRWLYKLHLLTYRIIFSLCSIRKGSGKGVRSVAEG